MWTKRKRQQMSYLHCGRKGNVDKCQTYNVDERKRWQMSYLPTWTKQKRRQMSNLQCGRNGNVDKCHTYTVDETETSTNVILTDVNETETSTNVILTLWTKRKRRQMSNLQRGRNGNVDKWHTYNGDETETSKNVILTDVNETETSTNVKLTMWTKRKRQQMSNLQCGRNGNVDKCHTYNGDEAETWHEAETLTNVIRKRRQMSYLPTWTKQKRRQMSNLKCERNGNVDKWHTYNGDETETSTNVILTDVNETETSTNVKLKMWTKRKRWQMSYLPTWMKHTYTGDETETSTNIVETEIDKCHTYNVDETETSTNVILTRGRNGNVRQMSYLPTNETETSTNVILTMWTKRKRHKCQTYNVNETETSTNVILTMWTKRKRRQMSYLTWTKRKRRQMSNLQCERNGNVDKCHS